jgi:hypothetical protein
MLRRFRRIASKKMWKIEIFKQNVMIRERVDQRSFRLRKCERTVSWRVKDEREIVHIVNLYRARIFIEIVDFYLQCADVNREIFDTLIVRDKFIIDIKTFFRIFVEFVK